MQLNIVKPESNNYCEAVGISPERQHELSRQLDEMVRLSKNGPPRLVKMHDIWAEIMSFCDNDEELIYCTVLHCGWQARHGRILAPGPLNYAVIALGIEMLYDRLRKDLTNNSQKLLDRLRGGNPEETIKEAAREGVQRLRYLGEETLACEIIDKLTGFAF